MIQLVSRRSLVDQIEERLLDAIVSGELRPGERIIETKLARHLGVGQSTLREALQGLEHKGLLTKYPNRGSIVTKLTEATVEEIYDVRGRLEPFAASLACNRMTEHHHTQLIHFLERMESAAQKRDFKELMKSDHAFHQLIWQASQNSVLEKTLEYICAPLFAFYLVRFSHFREATEGTMYDFVQDHQDHLRLFAALTSGDSQVAERVFQETLDIFRARHLKHVQEAEND